MIHITDVNKKAYSPQMTESRPGSVIDFETVIVLGNFDGIHIGHRKLIGAAKAYASGRGLALAAFSFSPHPISVLQNPSFCSIMTSGEKAFVFEDIGVDCLIEYPFDHEFASTTPYDFINNILLKKYNCRAIFVGESFRFGKNHEGDTGLLMEVSKEAGIEATIVPEMYIDAEKVSSTGIRRLISESNFKYAAKLLGCPFFMMGTVIHGNKLGRTIGFPTANLLIPKGKLLPRNGVYLTKTHFDAKTLPGITNIGVRPTVSDTMERVAETFLFNFNSNIYSKTIRVEFLERIRDEFAFGNIDELKKQIEADEKNARELLSHV